VATPYGRRIIRVQDEIWRLLDRSGLRTAYEDVRSAEYSYRRMSIRRLFFGVADRKLRQRLISLARELQELMPLAIEEDGAETTRELQASERKAVTGSWGLAAVIAGASVALGQLVFALPGAIGGALVGYFLGRGYVEASKAKAAADVQWAKARLEEIRRHGEVLPQKPALFSKSEAESGEEDKGFFAEVITQKNRASAG